MTRDTNPTSRDIWRSRLYSFAYVVSKKQWLPYRHVRLASDFIERLVDTPGGRGIIMMPPQTGKSQLTSIWAPAWVLDNKPETRIIQASYSKDKAAEWATKTRDLLSASPDTLTSHFTKARGDLMKTPEGGYIVATSVGGQMTGWSGDLIIIDDPVKDWAEAASRTIQHNHRMWFESVVDTRIQEDTTIILCMTRWHENDLAGYLMEMGGWEVLRLPALSEAADDPLGRAYGETICPERFSTAFYEAKRGRTPEMVWAGLYQQRPNVEGGTVFKGLKKLERWETIPTEARWYQSWDFSFGSTSDTASYVVGQVWAATQQKAYLVDQFRERTDFDGMVDAVKHLSQKYPRTYTKFIENKAAGPLIMQTLQGTIKGMVACEPTGDKLERALAVTNCFRARDVVLPNEKIRPWINDYIHELQIFPNGAADDQVDATTQFLVEWTSNSNVDWW